MSGTVWEPKGTGAAGEADTPDLSETTHEPNQVYDAHGVPEGAGAATIQGAVAAVRGALGAARAAAGDDATSPQARLIAAVDELLPLLDPTGENAGPETQE
jgi:hypothetical protein